MLELLLIMVCVSVSAIALWILRINWAGRKKQTRYVCNLCGERHCDCTIE